MKVDLHVHSTASDGTLTPSQVVQRAAANGVSVLALADHDSLEGLAEARAAARASGVQLVPAVELSAHAPGEDSIHLLGYFISDNDPGLNRLLAVMREARHKRAHQMVESLREAGFSIDVATVLTLSAGGAVGRSHVARALVSAGHASSVGDAFERLIGRGRPFYVSKEVMEPCEVIAVIKNAGGLAVLAHPGVNGLEHLVAPLVDCGLDGIEAYHSDHSPARCRFYARLAADRGLLVTAGSDFHGPDAPNPDIGSVGLPLDDVERFLAAGRDLRRS